MHTLVICTFKKLCGIHHVNTVKYAGPFPASLLLSAKGKDKTVGRSRKISLVSIN